MFNAAAAQAIANNWLHLKLGDLTHAGDPVLDGEVWRVPIHVDFPVPGNTDVLPFRNLGELVIEVSGDNVGAVGGCPTPREREARMAEEIGRVLGEIHKEISAFECGCCGKCCGTLGATGMEMQIIDEYIRRHSIEVPEYTESTLPDPFIMRTTKDDLCPYLQNHKCMVYLVRPTICRLFGTVTGHMDCEVSKREVKEPITIITAFGILRRVDVLAVLGATICKREAVT